MRRGQSRNYSQNYDSLVNFAFFIESMIKPNQKCKCKLNCFFFQLIYFTFIIYITWSPYNTVKRSKWNEANGRT